MRKLYSKILNVQTTHVNDISTHEWVEAYSEKPLIMKQANDQELNIRKPQHNKSHTPKERCWIVLGTSFRFDNILNY